MGFIGFYAINSSVYAIISLWVVYDFDILFCDLSSEAGINFGEVHVNYY